MSRAEFAAGAARADQVPPATAFGGAPEIAFAGRSNVGKSTLLNMLLSRRGLARTSNTPGCTRQINFFDVELAKPAAAPSPPDSPAAAALDETNPRRVVFVDLPGYGYAKVSKTESLGWKALLEDYLYERPALRAVVILVDVRRGLEQEESDLVRFLEQREGLPIIIAATKLDKLPRSAHKPAVAKFTAAAKARSAKLVVVATSGETGDGREALWSRILDACRVR